jgi:hypothetical protein
MRKTGYSISIVFVDYFAAVQERFGMSFFGSCHAD